MIFSNSSSCPNLKSSMICFCAASAFLYTAVLLLPLELVLLLGEPFNAFDLPPFLSRLLWFFVAEYSGDAGGEPPWFEPPKREPPVPLVGEPPGDRHSCETLSDDAGEEWVGGEAADA